MYVLSWRGTPVACAERLERLSEFMALYTAEQQADLEITSDVEVLT